MERTSHRYHSKWVRSEAACNTPWEHKVKQFKQSRRFQQSGWTRGVYHLPFRASYRYRGDCPSSSLLCHHIVDRVVMKAIISLEPEIQFSNSQGIHVKHGISIIHHKIWRMHRIATEDSIVLYISRNITPTQFSNKEQAGN